eukprot:CAMPEP_0185798532 /NCGR_PEP_ID=MMETSP1174-20130828/162197_1 /TAXON_ID=35687 /ORGANISM="Dictyocha speculum, Strain CCMP1381" /LENGTH=204 /DNA_ID=CAMNT_0028494035 /DNA_START=650 /DNA_END=1263 /DNA_ORIENTATION=+
MSWNQRIMLSTSNKRKLQAKEKASLYPTPTDDVVLWFAINMDFDAAEQHLRQNYMVLLTEYLNLGVSLFSLAMCGNPESLKKQHKMINKISEIREADDERYSFSAEQIRDLTPILAPYEALYGVYSKIFYEDVAKYLGGLEEEQVAVDFCSFPSFWFLEPAGIMGNFRVWSLTNAHDECKPLGSGLLLADFMTLATLVTLSIQL